MRTADDAFADLVVSDDFDCITFLRRTAFDTASDDSALI